MSLLTRSLVVPLPSRSWLDWNPVFRRGNALCSLSWIDYSLSCVTCTFPCGAFLGSLPDKVLPLPVRLRLAAGKPMWGRCCPYKAGSWESILSVPRVTITKTQARMVWTTEKHCLTVLEVRNPSSRCAQGQLLLQLWGRLFSSPPPGFWVSAGLLCGSLAHRCNFALIFIWHFPCLCLCVKIPPLLKIKTK